MFGRMVSPAFTPFASLLKRVRTSLLASLLCSDGGRLTVGRLGVYMEEPSPPMNAR